MVKDVLMQNAESIEKIKESCKLARSILNQCGQVQIDQYMKWSDKSTTNHDMLDFISYL